MPPPLKQKMIRRKKNVKKGIQFCLMVCGASGTGESTIRYPMLYARPAQHRASYRALPQAIPASAADNIC